MIQCQFCQKECKNANSHRNHERLCPQNLNRVLSREMKGKTAWNKGLSKETSPIIAAWSVAYKAKIANGEIVPKRNSAL